MRLLRLALTSARLSRLITTDSLGEWAIIRPAEDWAVAHDGLSGNPEGYVDPELGWRSKLVTGLECPFCVGFWIGVGVLATDALVRDTRWERPWKFATTALAMNYVTAHVSSRLDGEDDDE